MFELHESVLKNRLMPNLEMKKIELSYSDWYTHSYIKYHLKDKIVKTHLSCLIKCGYYASEYQGFFDVRNTGLKFIELYTVYGPRRCGKCICYFCCGAKNLYYGGKGRRSFTFNEAIGHQPRGGFPLIDYSPGNVLSSSYTVKKSCPKGEERFYRQVKDYYTNFDLDKVVPYLPAIQIGVPRSHPSSSVIFSGNGKKYRFFKRIKRVCDGVLCEYYFLKEKPPSVMSVSEQINRLMDVLENGIRSLWSHDDLYAYNDTYSSVRTVML